MSPATAAPPLFEYLLRLADDRLILGHRTSEWCGHGPILEEDIALANIALDLIGQANMLLQLAAAAEGGDRDADALAFLRDAREYRNALIVELPRGDFDFTVMRQFLFATYASLQWEALGSSKHEQLAGVAAKALKESRYHVRHSAEWVVRLGDGTAGSHERVQKSLDDLWRYTGELFRTDDIEQALVRDGLAADSALLAERWMSEVSRLLARATLRMPDDTWMQSGGRSGLHTEHLGHLLAEMQVLPRSYPGAQW